MLSAVFDLCFIGAYTEIRKQIELTNHFNALVHDIKPGIIDQAIVAERIQVLGEPAKYFRQIILTRHLWI